MAEQRLKHVVFEIDSVLYFYDGELPVKEGVVTIPDGADVWAGAAWVQGYQIDADTGEQLLHSDVTERALAAALPVAPATEAPAATEAEAPEEGADGGQEPEGLAVELASGEEAGVPEPEGEGEDEASQDD